MNIKTAITMSMLVKIMGIARMVFFVLGVVICFSTHQFFSGCNKPQQPAVSAIPVPHDAAIAKALAPYEQRLSQLQAENTSLRTEVADIRNSLSRTKRKAASLEQKLQQQISTGQSLSDTAALLNNCDSLQQSALQLLNESAAKDSLYETLTGTLEQQVTNRDSVLAVQAYQYNLLLTDYNQTQVRKQLLTLEKEHFQTQYKRQRTKSRLLSAGLVIVGASASYLLLHR